MQISRVHLTAHLERDVAVLAWGVLELLAGQNLQILTDALACCGRVDDVINVS